MPQNYSYPGVYVEEIPSAVRTIMGVPTSIVAFIGHAKAGPFLEPTTIFDFAEFRDTFGGLWPESTLGYAVRDFYLNSPGGQAIIVRVPVAAGEQAAPGEEGAPTSEEAVATATVSGLELEARSPGVWGDELWAEINRDDLIETRNENVDPKKTFNLIIMRPPKGGGEPVPVETFKNVSTDIYSPRRVDNVLESTSDLVRLAKPLAEDYSPTVEATEAVQFDDGADVTAIPKRADYAEALEALGSVDIFNLLCILPPGPPPQVDPPAEAAEPTTGGAEPDTGDAGPTTAEAGSVIDDALIDLAIGLCQRKRAMLIIDPPAEWDSPKAVLDNRGKVGTPSAYAALYFPRIRKSEPTLNTSDEVKFDFPPSGAIAGVIARIDVERGVWKAPAGLDAVMRGAPDLSVNLSDLENGLLNPKGINALRVKPGPSRVVWGARTRVGSDELASPWKYIPVRRLANFIEESLYRGIQWAVFEPNDEPLWAALRLNVGAFMHSLYRQGAFQGATPRDAYFVKCDEHTTTQDDINRGIVNIIVGFAPLKPAEFVVLKLEQIAGTIET